MGREKTCVSPPVEDCDEVPEATTFGGEGLGWEGDDTVYDEPDDEQ